MGHLGRFTSTPYLVLFILLGAVGVSTAYAAITITLAADVKITGDTELDGKLIDTNNEAGTSGQVLSSIETGIDWIDASSGPQGATGMTGMTGVGLTGATGTPGMTGATGMTGMTGFHGFYILTQDGTGPFNDVPCDFGDKVTGGGYFAPAVIAGSIHSSYPSSFGTADGTWTVESVDGSNFFTAYAVCADFPPQHVSASASFLPSSRENPNR